MQRFCIKCGAEFKNDEVKFCTKCGARRGELMPSVHEKDETPAKRPEGDAFKPVENGRQESPDKQAAPQGVKSRRSSSPAFAEIDKKAREQKDELRASAGSQPDVVPVAPQPVDDNRFAFAKGLPAWSLTPPDAPIFRGKGGVR